MFQTQRYNLVIEVLNRKKSASIETLCKETFCSVATMRRDLIALEKSGLITRNRGGATIAVGANAEYSYDFRDTKQQNEKAYIAKIAKDFIADGMSLFLDSSSTVFPICKVLEAHKNISVVTNGIVTGFSLAHNPALNAYISGGQIKSKSAAIVGAFSTDFIQNFKADLAIISCRGIDKDGVYEASEEQVLIKRQMMKHAKATILLCDNSKFGNTYFYKLCDFSELETVITDKSPPKIIEEAMLPFGCECLF